MSHSDFAPVVLFVGDEPSAKNAAYCIPFFGTNSYKRLKAWTTALQVRPVYANSNTEYWLNFAARMAAQDTLVVALGKQAAKRLTDKNVPFVEMPHPSGRNLQLNNPEYVAQKLNELKAAINAKQGRQNDNARISN